MAKIADKYNNHDYNGIENSLIGISGTILQYKNEFLGKYLGVANAFGNIEPDISEINKAKTQLWSDICQVAAIIQPEFAEAMSPRRTTTQ